MNVVTREETITLDALDRRLIRALGLDGRVAFRRLAQVLGSSEQTMARRYRRLREAGVLRVVVLPNPRRYQENLFVRIRTTPGAAEPIGAALCRRPDVAWVTLSTGGTEVICALRSDDPRTRDDLMLKGLPRLSQVTDVSTANLLHAFGGGGQEEWHAFEDSLTDAEVAALLPDGQRSRSSPAAVGDGDIGAEDAALLDLLAVDGRLSYAALASASGGREGAIARRIDGLLRRGLLFTDVEVAYRLIGYRALATLWLAVPPADLHRVGSEVAVHPEVGFVGALSGRANLVVSVVCRDTADLYRYVTERLGTITAIRELEITVTARQLKQAGTVMDGDRLPDPLA